MSVYQYEGKWRYQGHVRINGALCRPAGTPRINSRAAALAAEREHIARLMRPTSAESKADSSTFATMAGMYMEHAAPVECKPSEVDSKRHKLVYLNDWIGARPVGEINRADIDRVRAKLRPDGLKLSTVNNYLSVIGAVLDYAIERGEISARPRLGIKRPDVALQPSEIYREAEVDALLAAARGDIMERCALLLGFDAGLRAGEIRALHRADIVGSTIHVNWSCYGDKVGTPKSGKGRRVNMSKRLADAVRAALLAHAGPRVLARQTGGGRWRKFEGTPWTKESMRLYQPGKGWHALRHGFCTRLAERGVAAAEIMAVAGHASIKTSERYIHLEGDKAAACVAVLDTPAPRRGRAGGRA